MRCTREKATRVARFIACAVTQSWCVVGHKSSLALHLGALLCIRCCMSEIFPVSRAVLFSTRELTGCLVNRETRTRVKEKIIFPPKMINLSSPTGTTMAMHTCAIRDNGDTFCRFTTARAHVMVTNLHTSLCTYK